MDTQKIANCKARLIQEALMLYPQIAPCGKQSDFSDCFSMFPGRLVFWFNTPDNTTKVVTADLETE